MIEYLCLAHQLKMVELKGYCMEWLSDRWDTVRELKEIQDLKGNNVGREIIWELLDYEMSKKLQ